MTNTTQHAALLVMDMQSAILAAFPDPKPLVDKINAAIAKARQNDMPVIFVVVGFRNGAPEVSTNNKSFSIAKERYANVDMNEFMKVTPALAMEPGDVTVTKRRISAFTGSDLEVVLRAKQIDHLVLCGVATGGVVLPTVREAADKDYKLTILSDCCVDPDPEIHNVLMNKVFVRSGEVVTAEEWIAA